MERAFDAAATTSDRQIRCRQKFARRLKPELGFSIEFLDEEQALLAEPLVPLSRSWLAHVNLTQTEAELTAIRHNVQRGQPFDRETWQLKFARQLGLEHTFRARVRPKKQTLAEPATEYVTSVPP